ncbi:MFS transporter [Streptomyces sparsogenes]|uniref:Major facilitator superfamily permease n=1 Tax=Streptomyces sparsogenes DSM 40356 TaxID=1331668 RepID=A0A1R1S677_9ACTN|nr:MFS transporter [Streptomyces sparsogenes]OMI33788.1 major facilitator superfamily permease [Streptomyces sparsogenes DSM 40356]
MTALDPRDTDVADSPLAPLAPPAPVTPPAADLDGGPAGDLDGGLSGDLDGGEGGDDGGSVLGRRYRALTLGIVSVVSLIAFEASAVNTAMPVAARALDGVELYAYAFSAYFTASLFAMALSGEWCDRRGPLVPLFTGIAAFGAGLVVSGSAQNMWTFVGGRAVQGIGGGLVVVSLYVLVGRAYPQRLQPAVLASFSAAWVLPVIVGPLVAGTVTEQAGWRWVFLSIPVLILLPLAVMLPALRKVERGRTSPAMNRRRILLALAVASGAGLLQYAGQDLAWISLVPAAAGLALLVPCVLRLLPRGTFRAARGLPSVVLLRGIAAGSFLGAESFVPLMLVTERGLSATAAGLSLTGGGLTWALGSYTQSRPRLEPYRERLMSAGMVLMATAIALVPLALLDSVPAWVVAVAWVIGGYGMGLVISSGSVLLLKLSGPDEAGSNSASLQVSDALGNITLVGLSGVLFVAFGGGSVAAGHAGAEAAGSASAGTGHAGAFAAVYVAMAAVALVGAAVTARLRPVTEKP